MLGFLYDYPNWAIASLFVASACGASIAIMLGLRAVLPLRADRETDDVALRAMPVIVSATAFVLAFSVVEAKNEQATAAKIATDEAMGIGQLDRLLARIDPSATRPARAALAAYAASIVSDEWAHMQRGLDGFGHATTRQRLDAFVGALQALDASSGRAATLLAEAVRTADQIEDLRDARLRESQQAVPGLFWAVILVLSVLMMALGAFIKPTLAGVSLVASQATAISLLAAFVFMLDHPFRGETRIMPSVLERVITTLSVRP